MAGADSSPSSPPGPGDGTMDSEPPSRAPIVPDELDPVSATQRRRSAADAVRVAAREAASRPTPEVAERVTSTSTTPPRKSRLSMLRETLRSMLPPLPKSFAPMLAPLVVIVATGLLCLAIALLLRGSLASKVRTHVLMARGDLAPARPALQLPSIVVDDIVGEVDENVDAAEAGRSSIARGVLSIPRTFRAAPDGAFDLVIHFHGNTELALESYEVALLDAAVLVINLGNGSGPYEKHYANPKSLERILVGVPEILAGRGLKNAHLRRVALVGWSAGYGAIVRAIADPTNAERVDTIVLLDGLHTSFRPGTHDVEAANVASIEAFARRAVKGERLLVITHSDIQPDGYLGVRETVDFLLGRLGLTRHEAHAKTTIPTLAAAKGVLSKDALRPLELKTEVREHGLVIRGFGGNEPAHHIGHLMQMAEIALPEVAKRWTAEPAPAPEPTASPEPAAAPESAAAPGTAAPD